MVKVSRFQHDWRKIWTLWKFKAHVKCRNYITKYTHGKHKQPRWKSNYWRLLPHKHLTPNCEMTHLLAAQFTAQTGQLKVSSILAFTKSHWNCGESVGPVVLLFEIHPLAVFLFPFLVCILPEWKQKFNVNDEPNKYILNSFFKLFFKWPNLKINQTCSAHWQDMIKT